MVRNIHIDAVDHVARPVVALGRTYPDGHAIDPHQHRRGQLISGTSGVMILSTLEGTWVMPPQRGLWIPPAVVHRVRMVGEVAMQSLYVEPDAVPGMSDRCQVVGISPFMRSLITEALDLPLEYDPEGRSGALMRLALIEMQALPVLPLSLPYPADGPLAVLCRRFLEEPDIHQTIDAWAGILGTSRRSFTRLFRRETGMSFVAWRQQACLLCALPQLAAGQSVTTVALNLGYENPAAFTLMFKRAFGIAPLTYVGLRAPRATATTVPRPLP